MESLSMSSLPEYLQKAYHNLYNDSPNNPTASLDIYVKSIPEIRSLRSPKQRLFYLLLYRHHLTEQIAKFGKCYPPQILGRAETYEALEYDDLAAFDAYVVYTLCQKELSDEFVTDLEAHSPEGEDWKSSLKDVMVLKVGSLALLVRCLTRLGAIDDARVMWKELQELDAPAGGETTTRPNGWSNHHLRWESVLRGPEYDVDDVPRRLETAPPSRFGFSRREIYPWSTYEPDRNTPEAIAELNEYLANIAPDLEARLTALPAFDSSGNATGDVSHQLGLFTKIDLEPGLEILSEKSILTAIRPLEDALCDACGQDLEGIPFEDVRQCDGEDCDITFCSQDCKDRAVRGYHRPNLEDSEGEDEGEDEDEERQTSEAGDHDLTDGMRSLNVSPAHDEETTNAPSPCCGNQDLSLIGRPTTTSTPEWDLYFLLLTRTIAMSTTQNIHPLNLPETKYLWADFNTSPFTTVYHKFTSISTATFPSPPPSTQPSLPISPRTLPFSLTHTIIHPLDYLTTLSQSSPSYTPYTAPNITNFDPWILQTLSAKFRGVANATQSTYDGQPEIAAVHPGWCLANHSCRPNVRWGGGGGVRRFRVRDCGGDVGGDSTEGGSGGAGGRRTGCGIKKDEEIWSHYTDVRLGVRERRARLREVLGGECRCGRCLEEDAVAAAVEVGGSVSE